MSQSTVIVGALLAAFVLYLAAKGRLSAYTAVLWGNTAQNVPTPAAATQTSIMASNASGQQSANPLESAGSTISALELAGAAGF